MGMVFCPSSVQRRRLLQICLFHKKRDLYRLCAMELYGLGFVIPARVDLHISGSV